MKHLPLNCHSIDRLLGGGIQPGIITKLYGEAGTGKTNICLQTAKQAATQGYTIAFVETEPISHERLQQICTQPNQDCTVLLNNIHFYKPTSFLHQEKIIDAITNREPLHLIIIDTINKYYRMELKDNEEIIMRSYTRQITNLQLTARIKKCYILITEQVYTDQQGEIKPFTHRDTEPMIKTIIKLEKKEHGQRQAQLIKHPHLQKNNSATFTIGSKGIT